MEALPLRGLPQDQRVVPRHTPRACILAAHVFRAAGIPRLIDFIYAPWPRCHDQGGKTRDSRVLNGRENDDVEDTCFGGKRDAIGKVSDALIKAI